MSETIEIRRDKRGRAVGLNWGTARPDLGDSVLAERAWEKAEAATAEADARVVAARAEADAAIAEIAAELKAAETATSLRELELGRYVNAVIAEVGTSRLELVTPEAVRFRSVHGVVTEWSAVDSWTCSCGQIREAAKSGSMYVSPGVLPCIHVNEALSRIGWRAVERMSTRQKAADDAAAAVRRQAAVKKAEAMRTTTTAPPTPLTSSDDKRTRPTREKVGERARARVRYAAARDGKTDEEVAALGREAYATAVREYDTKDQEYAHQ
jgi:hypothetical protein